MKEYYKITDGTFTRYYFAESAEDAIKTYSENYFADKPEATKVLTDQGYPIVRLGDLPEGTLFHRTFLLGNQFCEGSTTWRAGQYVPNVKRYICYRWDNHPIDAKGYEHFKREERVTIEPFA